ncbi:MAG: polysaccharide deacetylase family protein [Rhizobiales bacterium]|nr:polysaccharide deacetylase family protein [Hyphomicrobiales bacterium]
MQADWSLLTRELNFWSNAGIAPRLWLRDDDAIAPSKALDRLLALCDRYEVPVVLAIIPEPTGEELARHLGDIDLASVAVHGWRHANHAAADEKKQELGKHRPVVDIVDELSRGLSKLSTLYGEKSLPMLVPPWNRMDPLLMSPLSAAGFRAVSSFADALVDLETPDLAVINARLDIIDWPRRRGADSAELAKHVVRELQKSREGGFYPIGVLTHHLAHDESAWDFLDQLLEMTALGETCKWLPGPELLPSRSQARA